MQRTIRPAKSSGRGCRRGVLIRSGSLIRVLPSESTLLIVRLSAMGDVIHTLPAVQALREAFPQAHIGWLIEERWAELLCAAGSASARAALGAAAAGGLSSYREFVRLGKVSFSLSDGAADSHGLERRAGRGATTLLWILQGAMRSAVLARWSGARVIYGAAEPREAPASLLYTRQAVVRGEHVIEQNLSVAEALVGHRVNCSRTSNFLRDRQAEAASGSAA